MLDENQYLPIVLLVLCHQSLTPYHTTLAPPQIFLRNLTLLFSDLKYSPPLHQSLLPYLHTLAPLHVFLNEYYILIFSSRTLHFLAQSLTPYLHTLAPLHVFPKYLINHLSSPTYHYPLSLDQSLTPYLHTLALPHICEKILNKEIYKLIQTHSLHHSLTPSQNTLAPLPIYLNELMKILY